MAQFTRVNGDLLPVINYDQGSYENQGANAVESGATVQPQGPKLQFFTATGAGALTGDQLTTMIRAAEQKSTVHIYEYDSRGETLALALYPVDGWAAGDLETEMRDALTAAGTPDAVTVATGAYFD